MNKRSDSPHTGTTIPVQAHARDAPYVPSLMLRAPANSLNAILQIDGQLLDSIRVVGIGATHIQLSGPGLPAKLPSTIDLELFDDMLRMNVQATVETKNAFGLTGRFVQPGNLFQDWIASIID